MPARICGTGGRGEVNPSAPSLAGIRSNEVAALRGGI